jgi:hypothetical protein
MIVCCEKIEPGQDVGPELFGVARELQQLGVRFEYYNTERNEWAETCNGKVGFYTSSRYRRKPEPSTLSQFAGCVLDLLRARDDFNEQREHLNNANQNLAQFVGDGEARDVEIDGINHRVSNVGGSIMIVGG